MYVHVYHTAKFKSANSVKNVVWGKATKFDDRQYFRLYTVYTIFIPLLFTTQIIVPIILYS